MLAGGQLMLASSIGAEIRVRLPFGGSNSLGDYAARTNR
jgi:hypothetical protein